MSQVKKNKNKNSGRSARANRSTFRVANPSITELGRAAYPANKRSGDGIDDLVRRGVLSADGANWLTMAIDPFHDYKKPMAGYPDIDPSGSTVICKKYTTDLSAPAGAEWDAHVFSSPISRAQLMAYCTSAAGEGGSVNQVAMTSVYKPSVLTIISANTGGDLYPSSAVWAPPDLNIDQMPADGDDSLLVGTTRIVAAGFEIVNTTPEMYKGGRILVYSMPQCDEITSLKVHDGTAGNLVDGTTTTHVSRANPVSASVANHYLGSRSWAAADGAYVPIPLRKLDNPYRMVNSTAYSTRLDGDPGSDIINAKFFGGVASDVPYNFANKETALGSVGVFLTGLSPQSSFTITLRLFIEKIPSHDEVELCALASPSAAYDQTALKLYSYLLTKLPVGVEVAANAHGDWFRSILKTLYGIAKPIAGLFPGGRAVVDRVYNTSDKVISTVGDIFPIVP